MRPLVKNFILAWSVVISLGLVFVVLVTALGKTRDDYERNRDGRRVAVEVTCAAIKSLVEGGVTIVAASAILPGDRAVGRPGSPGFKVISGKQSLRREQLGALESPERRVRDARRDAFSYRRDTTAGIEAASGVNLTGADGKIDCRKLRSATLTAKGQ